MQKGFVPILIVLLAFGVLVIGEASYWYYSKTVNRASDQTHRPLSPTPFLSPTPSPVPALTLTPTPAPKLTVDPYDGSDELKVKIIGDQIYQILPSGKLQPLTQFYNTQTQSIFKDWQTSLSPDKTKIFLLGYGGLSQDILYWSWVKNPSLKELSVAYQASWSPDSRYLAYLFRHGDCGPVTGFGLYDTNQDKPVDVSNKLVIPDLKYDDLGFSNIKWAPDSHSIQLTYTAYDGIGCGASEIKSSILTVPLN